MHRALVNVQFMHLAFLPFFAPKATSGSLFIRFLFLFLFLLGSARMLLLSWHTVEPD